MSRALGRYELLRPLARGGMGEVYLARRRAAGVEKWLVVKRMRPERAGDTRFLELFMREARLSMSLAHQNIVPVFDFGRIDDQVFLAMERVEGKDLGSSIAKTGKPLPPLLAAFIAAECCKALDYAHRRKSPEGTDLGIVHRDVTPRNVLLSWSGEVKLTDFGIAALAGDSPSKVAGTPAYMAPEQARGEATDVRADIYAVGIVLREALTGERPRRGSDRETVLAAAQAGRLDAWPDGFDSPLRPIVDRATAPNKEDRYPDARAMLDELDAFIVGERAANKGDAPERQLAAWLASAWQGERDDDIPASGADIEANQLLSFIDDGPFDVIGTGTQRSMAATAADVDAEPKVDVKPQRPASEASLRTDPSIARKSRSWLVLVVALAVGGAVAVTYALTRRAEAPPKQPAAALDAQVVPVNLPADTAISDVVPVDAASDAAPDATQRVRPHPLPPRVEPKLTQHVAPPAPAATYKVWVGTRPNWSNYTIDDDPTVHQSQQFVHLTSGKHTLHFTGNEYHPGNATETIVVPENDSLKVNVELKVP